MKLTVLTENTTCREDLTCEHGLSLYIETGHRRILFDAGASTAFAENAEKLGIDLGRVDTAILSHGHYDHGGGLSHFLEINKTAPICLSRHAFGPHYNASGRYIGLDLSLKAAGRLICVEARFQIAEGITLHSCNGRTPSFPVEPYGLCRLEKGEYLPEDFRHEQYLLIEENGRRLCITGCSHRGILNIVSWFRPHVLIGGFHFMNLPPESPALTHAAETLLSFPTLYYTGHCTGQAQYAALKRIMGRQLHRLSTGTTLEL